MYVLVVIKIHTSLTCCVADSEGSRTASCGLWCPRYRC